MTTRPGKKCSIDDVKALARVEMEKTKAEKEKDDEKRDALWNACKTDASRKEYMNIGDRIRIHEETISTLHGIMDGDFSGFVEKFAACGMSCKEIIDLCVEIDGWARESYY